MSDLPPPPPPPPPSSPPPPPAGPALESVGPWPRFGARFIDGLVLFVPNLLIALAISGNSASSISGAGGFDNVVVGIITTFLGFAYAVWLESTRGQTVGKMALSIKTIGPDGRVPTQEAAARRNAWLLLSLVPLLGGLVAFGVAVWIGVSIANDPFNRGVHDNFAGGTAVVRAR